MQIAEFLGVRAADLHFGEDGNHGVIVVGIAGDPLAADEGDQGHFQAGDAVETPAAIDDGLDERAFFDADRFEGFFVFAEKSLIGFGFIRREKHGAAGEPGFDGVEADFGFAFFGTRAGAVLGIGAVGFEAGGGNGVRHFG